jgi:hypothetical protein
MMSCTTSAAWSRPVSSPCYTEHDQRCGAVLLGRITTVAMSRSDQLGLRCIVEPSCSDLFARLAGASVTRDRALDTCEPSCVPESARPFVIPLVHNPLGPWSTWQHWSSPLEEARPGPYGNDGAHLDREARSGAEEHVAAPELSSRGGRARSHGTRGSVGAHLGREARSGAEEHMPAPKLNSARRRGPGPRDTWQHRSSPQQGGEVRGHGTRGGSGAHLCRDVWSEATACVAAHGCTLCSLY